MACAGYFIGRMEPIYLSIVGIPSRGHNTPIYGIHDNVDITIVAGKIVHAHNMQYIPHY